MPRVRYIIKEAPGFDNTRVFRIRKTTERFQANQDVWFADGKCWCCQCSGPTVSMRSSCYHARAVQRWIRNRTPEAIAAPWSRGKPAGSIWPTA